jgi:stage III sporulation protein AD
MDIARIVSAGIIVAVLAVALRRQGPEFSLVIALGGSLLILFMVLPRLGVALKLLERFAAEFDGETPYVDVVLKIIGVAYLAEFGAQICADAGETAVASKIELAGKILIMVIAAPVLLALLDVILGILP